MKFTNGHALLGMVMLLAVAIGIGPLITIFALNGLFGLMIAYNFTSWFSVVWLSMIAAGIARGGK